MALFPNQNSISENAGISSSVGATFRHLIYFSTCTPHPCLYSNILEFGEILESEEIDKYLKTFYNKNA